MVDPYAPKSSRRVNERADAKDAVLERLARLGAKPDVLAETAATWPPPAEIVDYLLTASDTELGEELARIEAEYAYATTTDEEEAVAVYEAKWRAAVDEVAVRLAGNVEDAVAWIGVDPVRAEIALDHETSELGKGRKGVTEHCGRVLDGLA